MNKTELLRQMGRIKVAIIGNSNSGKSTLVNALCCKFVVPELSHTSTWMTTYLGNASHLGADCAVIGRNGYYRQYHYEEFRKELIYNEKIIYEGQKSSGTNKYGFVHIKHLLGSRDVTLIDSIGTGVNQYDAQRSAIVARQADIIVYVYDSSRSSNLIQNEIQFLKNELFPDGIKPRKPCQRIFFVPNKIDCVTSVTEICRTLRYSLQTLVSPQTLYYRQLITNIIPISALYGRIALTGIGSEPTSLSFSDQGKYEEVMQRWYFESEIRNNVISLREKSHIDSLIKAIKREVKCIKLTK